MEKVTIKSVKDSGKLSNDNPVIIVELQDGRKGTAFTSEALKWEGEVQLDIASKPYKGEERYYFFPPKKDLLKKGFSQKDYAFEKRSASMLYAIQSANLILKDKISSKEIVTIAEVYYQYLNSK